ncbi:class I SAM-dependent methyltransferase [Winogradskyella alexanderae]|uniref:Class I SAM-dependent methyltransferase n=1 Tax=Winogradskyella alexanderae TaxID=2877123 RepID=A0ABS7XTU6_9FLAO|nr:class I SAM-dependent methyltransferase [Winogradskyella alexanderae]MCA0132863.1 class I SAM-dependent methyltransferase [Winogradskyella alexanderae]
MDAKALHSSSFRDPSGYIFLDNGEVKRVINPIYFRQYKALTESGFYKKLFKNGLLIPHDELSSTDKEILIKPEQIPFITYPYEWSFNMYKEAALLTLKIQKVALENGFSLKDASAFNITFHRGSAVFIDTLSFDFYEENIPWRAYKQFVMHFLSPLVLSYYHGADQLKLIRNFIDGIPVTMASSLLPFKTKFSPILFSNIHLLAKLEQKHNEDYKGETAVKSLSLKGQLNIIKSLYNFIKNLKLKTATEWGNYYDKINYSEDAFNHKSEIINTWIQAIKPNLLIDIGGNDGTFAREIDFDISEKLVCDIDNNAVDANYMRLKKSNEQNMLPFVLDVLNPSPGLGLNNEERTSFLNRIKDYAPDVVMALAVIHHMSLSGNVPFRESARFFAHFSNRLIIEFPKRNDSWVQRLLKSKGEFETYFDFYSSDNFEMSYTRFFKIEQKIAIKNSDRVMYLMKRKVE